MIVGYSIVDCTDYGAGWADGNLPMDWTFEARTGSAWVVLDTRRGVTDWVYGVKKSFTFANTTPFTNTAST